MGGRGGGTSRKRTPGHPGNAPEHAVLEHVQPDKYIASAGPFFLLPSSFLLLLVLHTALILHILTHCKVDHPMASIINAFAGVDAANAFANTVRLFSPFAVRIFLGAAWWW
jgi:hypothetical protein